MADITMCINNNCPLANTCYRVQAKPSPLQSYFNPLEASHECLFYIPIIDLNKVTAEEMNTNKLPYVILDLEM